MKRREGKKKTEKGNKENSNNNGKKKTLFATYFLNSTILLVQVGRVFDHAIEYHVCV